MQIVNDDKLDELTEKAFKEKKKLSVPELLEKVKARIKAKQEEFLPFLGLLYKDLFEGELNAKIFGTPFEVKNEVVKHIKASAGYCKLLSGFIELVYTAETEGEKYDYWETLIEGNDIYFITPKEQPAAEEKQEIPEKKTLNRPYLDYLL